MQHAFTIEKNSDNESGVIILLVSMIVLKKLCNFLYYKVLKATLMGHKI